MSCLGCGEIRSRSVRGFRLRSGRAWCRELDLAWWLTDLGGFGGRPPDEVGGVMVLNGWSRSDRVEKLWSRSLTIQRGWFLESLDTVRTVNKRERSLASDSQSLIERP